MLFSALLSWLFGSVFSVNAESDRPLKPNIVFILSDDLGWQDVKCYDIDDPSPMETPHIDALAKRGVIITLFLSQRILACFIKPIRNIQFMR